MRVGSLVCVSGTLTVIVFVTWSLRNDASKMSFGITLQREGYDFLGHRKTFRSQENKEPRSFLVCRAEVLVLTENVSK